MNYRYLRLIFSFLVISKSVLAQEKKDMDIKIASLPYYNFGRGVGITSPDSLYQLNIRFRMQNRVSFNHKEPNSNSIDGQIRRLRLRFDGYVGNPRFTYAIQLSFAPGDVGEIEEGTNLNIIRDAVVFYNPNKNWTIGFGQTKLPGNRQRVNSSGALQFTDRTINNARFNIDRDFGLQVYYLRPTSNEFTFNIKTAISTGEGRNFTDNDDLGLAYTAKLELLPGGYFTKGGDYFEGDLMREKKLKTMLSVSYHFNDDAKKTQGELGELMAQKADLHSVLADFMLKKSGFALMATYMSRQTKNPLLSYDLDKTFVFAGHGYDFQTSYINRQDVEFLGRYSSQKMDKVLKGLSPDTQQYSAGVTKYFREHAFKLQGEFTYQLSDVHAGDLKRSWYTRFQVEMGI